MTICVPSSVASCARLGCSNFGALVSETDHGKKRRTLSILVSATGCAALGLVSGPSLRLLLANADPAPAAARFLRVPCRVSELELDRPRRVVISEGTLRSAIWLVRSALGTFAFAARCPHLGCSVGLAEDAKSFACPCHHAAFSLSGARLGGAHNPAPRDMDALELRVDDASGEIDVRVVQYLPGTAERVAVGDRG